MDHETHAGKPNTKHGKFSSEELTDIFAMLMVSLDLKDQPPKRKSILFSNKYYPYSFLPETAIEHMMNMKVEVGSQKTTKIMSCGVKPLLGKGLLIRFMSSHLIHSPVDRTRVEPKDQVLLQPTAKGVAMLQKFCDSMGIKETNLPDILNSPFNSMDLITLERNEKNDKIVYSENLLFAVLFKRLMGTYPNVYTPTSPPDPIPRRIDRRLVSGIMTIKEQQSSTIKKDGIQQKQLFSLKLPTNSQKTMESPYYLSYCSHPDSDSLSQYFISNKGIRIFKNKDFEDETIGEVTFSFTGKSIFQWLMDCTNILNRQEAIDLASFFLTLKYDLITPIPKPVSGSKSCHFVPSKDVLYTLTAKGLDITPWLDDIKEIVGENPIIKGTKRSPPPDITHNINGKVTDVHNIDHNNATLNVNDQTFEELNSLDDSMSTTAVNSLNVDPDKSADLSLSLDEILLDPGMKFLFKSHLQKEFCLENLEGYLEFQKFSNHMNHLITMINDREHDKKELKKHYNSETVDKIMEKKRSIDKAVNKTHSLVFNIYGTFLASGSPSELNIDYELKKNIDHIMQSKKSKSHNKDNNMVDTFITYPAKVYSPDKPLVKSFQIIDPNLNIYPEGRRILEKSATIGTTKTKHEDLKDASFSKQTGSNTYEEDLTLEIEFLEAITEPFNNAKNYIYKLMKIDSLPKFLTSEIYQQSIHR